MAVILSSACSMEIIRMYPSPHLEVVLFFFLPDPVQGLLLRINTERIPTGVSGKDSILD